MNIQDEMQKIHHKFGVSEMANYKIEQFIENLIKKDRAKQLTLTGVVVPKETLPNNCKGCGRTIEEMGKMTSMCGVSACPNY